MAKKVIIAGAGPSGLLLARELGKAGFSVLVLEALDEQRYNKRHDWSDAIARVGLHAAGLDKAAELYEPHQIDALRIFAPDYDAETDRPIKFDYLLTDRVKLRAIQRKQAEEAGAELRFETEVEALLFREGAVCGVMLADGEELTVDLVVDATGARAALRTQHPDAVLSVPFTDTDFGYAHRTVRRVSLAITERPAGIPFVDHYRYGSYGGYCWIHFHGPDIADIGGGLPLSGFESAPSKAREIVEDMISQLPAVTDEELRGGSGAVLVGASPGVLTADGFLVVGDCAGQVNPTNGCGVSSGFQGTLMAAEVIKKSKSFDNASLWEYNVRWFTGVGAHFAALTALRRQVQSLTHAQLSRLMNMDVLNGAMLEQILHGQYKKNSPATTLRALWACARNPAVLSLLQKGGAEAEKAYRCCLKFPRTKT